MGTRVEWSTGSAIRRGSRDDHRYTFPLSLHAGAFRIALATPLGAALIVLSSLLLAS